MPEGKEATDSEDFQEVSDFAVLSVDAGDDTLKVRKPFHQLSEVIFECRMIYEVLDGVESCVNR